MSEDRAGPIASLLSVPVPDGVVSELVERYDRVCDHMFRKVEIRPASVPRVRGFPPRGVVTTIRWCEREQGYYVGVTTPRVGSNVQSAGRVVYFRDAASAVECALMQIRMEYF